MKLKLFSTPQYLPNNTMHVPLLYPFLGEYQLEKNNANLQKNVLEPILI